MKMCIYCGRWYCWMWGRTGEFGSLRLLLFAIAMCHSATQCDALHHHILTSTTSFVSFLLSAECHKPIAFLHVRLSILLVVLHCHIHYLSILLQVLVQKAFRWFESEIGCYFMRWKEWAKWHMYLHTSFSFISTAISSTKSQSEQREEWLEYARYSTRSKIAKSES